MNGAFVCCFFCAGALFASSSDFRDVDFGFFEVSNKAKSSSHSFKIKSKLFPRKGAASSVPSLSVEDIAKAEAKELELSGVPITGIRLIFAESAKKILPKLEQKGLSKTFLAVVHGRPTAVVRAKELYLAIKKVENHTMQFVPYEWESADEKEKLSNFLSALHIHKLGDS